MRRLSPGKERDAALPHAAVLRVLFLRFFEETTLISVLACSLLVIPELLSFRWFTELFLTSAIHSEWAARTLVSRDREKVKVSDNCKEGCRVYLNIYHLWVLGWWPTHAEVGATQIVQRHLKVWRPCSDFHSHQRTIRREQLYTQGEGFGGKQASYSWNSLFHFTNILKPTAVLFISLKQRPEATWSIWKYREEKCNFLNYIYNLAGIRANALQMQRNATGWLNIPVGENLIFCVL